MCALPVQIFLRAANEARKACGRGGAERVGVAYQIRTLRVHRTQISEADHALWLHAVSAHAKMCERVGRSCRHSSASPLRRYRLRVRTRPSQGRNRGSNPRIATNPAFPDFHDSGQYGPRLLRSFESFASGLWIDGRKCHAIPYGRVGVSLATQKLPRA
jgi:hypothetical protein